MATTLKYITQVKAITPTGEAPVWPDFAVPMVDGPTVTNPAGYPGFDFHYKNWRDEISLAALTVEPAALTPVVSSDPKVSGASLVRFMASNDQVIFDETSVVTSTGLVVENLGAGLFRTTFDSALVAATPSGQTINAVLTVRARKKWSPTEYITFSNVQLSTTGTATTVVPAPVIIGQPQPRSFSEGVVTNFDVDIASFFSVAAGALPATYAVYNADGTALSGYTLNSLVSGVANISNPSAAGTKSIRYQVTDNLGRVAFVIGNYEVVANPLPIILSTPPDRNVVISGTGSFALAAATLFSDTEALTYALKNADGTNPPAGYAYDGTTLDYPTEGGAVTRSFIIRATESGALARSVDTAAFEFDRPASAVVIVTAADVTFPENAVTTKRIDVRTILGTDAAEAITLADGSALPGRYSVNALGSGVFDVTGTFSNNQIMTDAVKYAGTAAGSPVQALPNFKSYHNPPVDGVPATIVANADQPITINVVALSDDPTNNLIVAGSAFVENGNIAISADFKSLVITPPNPLNNQLDYSYTLEATSGGPQTAVTGKVMDFRAVIGPIGAGSPTISTQSTDGTAFPSFSLLPYWTAGSYPIDLASFQFYDSNDVALGKTLTVGGAGTYSINNSGVASFTAAAAGYVGVQNLRVAPSDINGNVAETIKPWVHTQIAKPSDPPPPDPNSVFPNTLDGKPIIQLGVENPMYWSGLAGYFKNARQIIPLRAEGINSKGMWSTNLKTAFEKIRDGEHDTTTGWFKLAPTEDTYFYHPRWYQSGGDASLNEGDWEIDVDVMTGGTATFTIQGWAETGSTSGNSGGQSALVNGGSPFTFDRKRYVRNLTASDVFQAQYRIQNNTGSDIWIRYWYGGLVSDFATWTTQPIRATALADMYEQKVLRVMDSCWPALARAGYADDMVQKGDYITFGDGGSWVSRLTANNFYRRTGADIHMWAKACVDSSTALWFNVPMTFGMGVTDGIADGFYTSSATAGFGTAGHNAYKAVVSANFSSIIAAAKIEYRTYAQRCIQNLIDAGYPDNFIVYIEIGNENWNSLTPLSQRYCLAVEGHIRNRTDGKPVLPATSNGAGGCGYIANLMFTEFARVISEMKPNQQHKFVVGVQTPSQNWGDRYCMGWNTYIQEFPTNSLPIARTGLTTTNYWSGAFNWNPNRSPGRGNPWGVATEAEFVAAFQASYAVSLQNLENDIVAWYTNPTSTNSSIYGQMAFIDLQVATSNKYGCEYIGSYEGSFHEDTSSHATNAGGLLGFTLGINTLNSIRNSILLGSGGDAITRAAIQAFVARYPGKIISNYYKYCRTNSFGNGGAWFEKSLSNFGTAPTTGAAKAWYDYGRQGAVAPPPTTGGVFKETFEINNTTALLQAQGWTLGTGYSVVSDASQSSLYNPSEFNDATKIIRTSAQANGNIALRMKFKPNGNTAAYCILEQSATGDKIVVAPVSGGHLSVSYLGSNAPVAVTTSGVNFLDGNYHDITITYYAALAGGLIEVKNTVTSTVYATLSGNTALHYSQAGTAANVDKLTLRGLVYYGELEDVTSAPPASPMWYTPFRLDYAAGTEAGFVQRIDTSHFSTGAAHEFFQRAQADGGDIRVYTDNGLGTRLPLHIVSFNKAAGTILAYTRVTGSRVQNDTIILEVGGDGTKSQPAANAAFGSQAVYADFDFVSHDLTKNEKTGEILSLNGTAVVAGPNTLSAKGFTSQGTGSTFKKDAINSAFTTNEANITAFILTYRSGNGNLGFGRIFHMSNGDDLFNESTTGYRLEREFSTTDGEWRITRPSASTWASVSYSHDGSTSAPAMYGNGAAMAVTTVTAPVGTFVPGNTAHVIGNHTNYATTGSERNWDGRLCEYWRLSAVKNAAWHLAMHTQLISPATFASAQTGSATP